MGSEMCIRDSPAIAPSPCGRALSLRSRPLPAVAPTPCDRALSLRSRPLPAVAPSPCGQPSVYTFLPIVCRMIPLPPLGLTIPLTCYRARSPLRPLVCPIRRFLDPLLFPALQPSARARATLLPNIRWPPFFGRRVGHVVAEEARARIAPAKAQVRTDIQLDLRRHHRLQVIGTIY